LQGEKSNASEDRYSISLVLWEEEEELKIRRMIMM